MDKLSRSRLRSTELTQIGNTTTCHHTSNTVDVLTRSLPTTIHLTNPRLPRRALQLMLRL